MAYDFKNTTLPKLKPLKNSFANGTIEAEYRDLFLELYSEALAVKFFDVTVLGSAQLGSLDLVRKAINNDGLVMLEGDTEEVNTRRIYRAWMARNNQGRGLHFLRAYLQLIFPNVCDVDQLWQKKNLAYPLFAYSKRTNPDILDNPQDYYLTSRIEVSLDPNVDSKSVRKISAIARSIIPARLVPNFRFLIIFLLEGKFTVDWWLALEKKVEIRQQWSDYYIEPELKDAWNLGDDNYLAEAPQLINRRINFTHRLDKYLSVGFPFKALYIEPRLKDAWFLGDDNQPTDAPVLMDQTVVFTCDIETGFVLVTTWPKQDFPDRLDKFVSIKAPEFAFWMETTIYDKEAKIEAEIEVSIEQLIERVLSLESGEFSYFTENEVSKAIVTDKPGFSISRIHWEASCFYQVICTTIPRTIFCGYGG